MVAGALVAGTVAVGIGLARSFAVLAEKEKSPDTLPRTFVDALIPWAEAQVDTVLHPKPRARRPANWVEQGLLGLDVLLLLIVAGIVAVWIIPSYGSVAAVDQAVDATKIAASFTPTPQPGPSATDLLQQEFAALPAGDATAGQLVFSTTGGCAVCHSLQPGVVIIGPSQSDVATRALTRKPGYSPELYIYESVTRPSAYVVPGFQDGLMPQTFKEALTPQQLADVVAYMMTLK
jgi:mono/diheme cytochrome c family protein